MADLTVGGGPPVGGEAQTFTVTTFAQTVLDDANAGAVRSTIGAGTSSFSGAYADLSGKPALVAVATSGLYSDLTGAPVAQSDAFTPVKSAEVNCTTVMFQGQWQRVEDTVIMAGRFTADPLLAATTTSFEMTLPVASDFIATENLAGVAFGGGVAGMGAAISASIANNTAVITWVSVELSNQPWSFTLTYQIL